ncbi:hypothetical protein ADL15_39590 [Actinoplanes awajinensis subsp. mycoplanecinus]|uniref:Uncharacterized protein n=2 Tax=Actinoplanes awajinensis TaxID=135946 RepID=A0A101JFI9_9ACTN|nr:hypothetical protein ADL15_39590 [Actinoplanes awajinensis subsp. mycoplanecinus]
MGWAFDALLGPLLGWIADLVEAALDLAWRLLSLTVLVVPDVTRLPQVQHVMGTALGVVNTCYVLAFVWTGVLVMNREWLASQAELGELIPRLVIGLIAANSAPAICSAITQTANALTVAMTGPRGASPVRGLQAATADARGQWATSRPEDFLLLIIGVFVAILAVLLVYQWIGRAGLLILLVGLAPIALALHGTPQTDPIAKLWWRVVLGAPATVVLQAVALHTTLQILIEARTTFPALGLSGTPGAAMKLLVVACLLWGVIRIPGLVGRLVTQTRPGRMSGLVRVLVVQQAARMLRVPVKAGRAAAGGAAARRNPAPGYTPLPPGSTPGPRPGGTPPSVRRPASRRAPVSPYTADQLRDGVDLYTQAMKRKGQP